ncbi:LysM domain protein [Acinetobacter baumannii]|uniref:Baseplate hub subunit n=1 Tax=Acinetobacter phage AbTZA1 TaxID=2500827 RepID=A0A3Q9R711_9CAUD|nr:baseplate hub [Acinetobacter phage AbTZA1]AZU98541.1 baseplate hub subunit [Acinetobacter phage AbTZA1]SSU39630.1 LysM domain protein [Acinetobacter baumannii]
MTMQKPGYPNVSIKLYEDYDAWKENRFIELAATFTTLTLRDGLYGINEGVLQFYDSKNLHAKLNGEQIIQISLSNANSKDVITRIYGCNDTAVSVDEKGDNILAFNLRPLHVVEDVKFSRAFFANATESIETMIKSIYNNKAQLAPKVKGLNVYVPRVAWVSTITDYFEYVREVGLSVESETHPFVWEDFTGINISDYKFMIDQKPRVMVVGDPAQIGAYIANMKEQLAYDFTWLAKTNRNVRNPLENVTVYSHSFNDKEIQRISIGEGTNSVVVSRSGGYSEMTYRNGYEEAFRLLTMAQYDGYATCKVVGDFTLTPLQKIIFGDKKGQFKTEFYIDEVVHVITNNSSETHLYVFTNGKDLVPVNIEKIKNEIETITPPSDTVQPEASADKKGAQWDLDKLAEVVTKNAQGRKSTGECALYVRKALQAAQLENFFAGGLGNANEMPPRLVQMGWIAVGQNVKNVKKGDIAVFQRTNTRLGQKYGHVCIFTGTQWVSDFIQSGVQPNRSDNLTYTVYRARYGYSAGG